MKNYTSLILFIATIAFATSTFVFYGSYDPKLFPIPDSQPLLTPAPYTFIIWALIYLWLIVATFLQWRHHGNEQQWEALRIPLLLSVTIGMLWNPISKQNELLGLAIMILMWLGASLSLIKAPSNKCISQYPIGLYAGWLTAAIGVSLGTILFNRGIVADPWASIIGILTTSLLALFLLPKISDVTTFVISIVWGLVGILVNVVNNMAKDGSRTVLILASVATVLLVVLGILHTKKQNLIQKK